MHQQRHEHFNRAGRGNGCQSRARDGTHLIEGAVGEGLMEQLAISLSQIHPWRRGTHIARRNDVIAVVAAETLCLLSGLRDVLGVRSGARAVAHDEEGVEAEGGVEDNLEGWI